MSDVKCPLCGERVELTQLMNHYATAHPEYPGPRASLSESDVVLDSGVRQRLTNWLERIKWMVFGLPIAYITLVATTEYRFEKIRPYLIKQAVEEGTLAGITKYRQEYVKGEHLDVLKRRARDKALRKLIKKLDLLMEE